MKFKFPIKPGFNPRDLIRRCGYGEWYDPMYQVTSYTKKMGGGNYPRFHIHFQEFGNYFEVDLHFDQKQESYSGTAKHAGEYDGDLVEDEARRITAAIAEVYGMSA